MDPDKVTALAKGVSYTAPKGLPAYATKAADLLAVLPIKGAAPTPGYEDRAMYGQAWADVDINGCDTRNDILKRDLTSVVFADDVHCKVESGILADPYTAKTIHFQRGPETSSAVQIDHVVALGDAWQKGAQQLTGAQRMAFANDPLNLQATDGPTDVQKADSDAAAWLPPNKSYRCDYVARQISVKATYNLWITQAEHDAMASVLGDCAGQLVPPNEKEVTVVASVEPTMEGSAESAASVPEPEPAAAEPAPYVPPAPVYVAPAPAPMFRRPPRPHPTCRRHLSMCPRRRLQPTNPTAQRSGLPGPPRSMQDSRATAEAWTATATESPAKSRDHPGLARRALQRSEGWNQGLRNPR